MRREGRLHGYEFDREEPHKRVKACNQATNRSKFRSKQPQEKAGRPRYKALKKIKGQRNKAHGSDVSANHKMHEWALRHTRTATCLADSIEEAALDPPTPPFDALRVLLLSDPKARSQAQIEQVIEVITNEVVEEEEEEVDDDDDDDDDEEDSDGSDWFDLGSTNGSDADDWFLC